MTRYVFSGDRMRIMRMNAGMSQATLAELVGTVQNVIWRYETGTGTRRVIPTINRALEICAALECEVMELCEVRG